MRTSCFDQDDARADYERDSRKHDTLPHRLDVPIDGAMEVACAVRDATNHHAAAGLIQAHVRAEIARALLDDTLASVGNKQRRRFAVAALIGECEALCSSGILPESREMTLRKLVVDALSSHGMNAANREEREHA